MSGYPYSQGAAQKPFTQFLEVEVLLTFSEYVGCTVYVGVSNPAISKLVQSTMDTFSAEGSSIRLSRIVDRNIVQVQAACLGGVRFFLPDVPHAVTPVKPFQCFTQAAEADLCELLVGNLTKIHTALEVTIVAAYYGSDVVLNAVVDDVAGNLADVVLCPVIAFPGQGIKPVRFLLPLFVGYALVIGFLLIPILVNRFQFTPVHDERRPGISYTCCQIFKADVDSRHIVDGNVLRFFLLEIAILNLEISAMIYGADTDFLDGLVFKPFRKWNLDLPATMQLGELPAHRHSQKSILDIYGIGGQEQVEHTAFSPIAGHLDVPEAIFT